MKQNIHTMFLFLDLKMTRILAPYLKNCGKKSPVVKELHFNYTWKKWYLFYVIVWHRLLGVLRERCIPVLVTA